MKIYTKTGDKGKTSLFGGERVPKHHIRIEAYGTVDELNSFIGLIKDQKIDEDTKKTLLKIQTELFTLGAMLATPPNKEKLKSGKDRLNIPKLNSNTIAFLENEIDVINKNLSPMTNFILPGGHPVVSYCHIARSVCRRAERICTLLNEESPINELIIIYLNRLSDYLFTLARKFSNDFKVEEIKWVPERY
jgi:cob(I)alamin adenosyltransferase